MINGSQLRAAIISAANTITNKKSSVDALNVFPVPDGDTGTNMSMTISAGVRELEKLSEPTVAETAKTASSALLRGARGNSGVILSLLFRGWSKGREGHATADAADLAKALAMGVEAAYKAVKKPTEGTILTVSRCAAAKAVEMAGTETSGTALLAATLVQAKETLAETPELLPILKKSGVVDAGGQGFVYILEGMMDYIKNGAVTGFSKSRPQPHRRRRSPPPVPPMRTSASPTAPNASSIKNRTPRMAPNSAASATAWATVSSSSRQPP